MTTTPRPLVAMIQNGQTNRPLGALVIRYLATKEPKKFSRFAKAIEKRDASERLFQRSFADYPTFTKPFLTWLESHQQPLHIRFDEWEHTGSESMLGHSKDHISITTFKDTVSLVQCHTRNRQDEAGRVGLVLSYRAQEDFTVALFNQKGHLEILTRAQHQTTWKCTGTRYNMLRQCLCFSSGITSLQGFGYKDKQKTRKRQILQMLET